MTPRFLGSTSAEEAAPISEEGESAKEPGLGSEAWINSPGQMA